MDALRSENIVESTTQATTAEMKMFDNECKPNEYQAIPALLILISIFGMLGNFVVIYIVIVLQEYKKTITNLYVVQLAISDFLFMVALPLEADSMIRGSFDFGNEICKIYQTLRLLSYYSSILFLMVMSVDRYLAINHATSPRMIKLRNKTSVYIISCLVWAICLGAVVTVLIKARVNKCKCDHEPTNTEFSEETDDVPIDYYVNYDALPQSYDDVIVNATEAQGSYSPDPYSYYPGEEDMDELDDYFTEQGKSCSFDLSPHMKTTIYSNFFGVFIIPLIIIVICYVKIVIRISQPMKTGMKSTASQNARKKVTKMVISLVATFVICWLPYYCYMLARIQGIAISKKMCLLASQIVKIVAYFNSALNPVLYTFLGTNFKSRWSEAIGKTRSIRPSFGSRADYNKGKRLMRKRSSQTGDGNSQTSMTKHTMMPQNNHVANKVNPAATEDAKL